MRAAWGVRAVRMTRCAVDDFKCETRQASRASCTTTLMSRTCATHTRRPVSQAQIEAVRTAHQLAKGRVEDARVLRSKGVVS
eukprot:5629432-Prymnesium_polylepis.1